MTVTPETFRNHLRWLSQRFEIVRLSQWIQAAERGERLPRRACALTFDDGWRDNYEFALPELLERRVPATVFAVSDLIGTRESFWSNRLARVLTHLGRDAHKHQALYWLHQRYALPRDRIPDREDISAAISACKQLTDDEVAALLTATEHSVGWRSSAIAELLNWDEVRAMAATGLVEIGSHTCRHVRLTDGTAGEVVTREILESKATLERELKSPVVLFCYPNGDVSRPARALVAAHYDGAVVTKRGVNTPATSPHELMRIGMHEDATSTRDNFFARLSGWM